MTDHRKSNCCKCSCHIENKILEKRLIEIMEENVKNTTENNLNTQKIVVLYDQIISYEKYTGQLKTNIAILANENLVYKNEVKKLQDHITEFKKIPSQNLDNTKLSKEVEQLKNVIEKLKHDITGVQTKHDIIGIKTEEEKESPGLKTNISDSERNEMRGRKNSERSVESNRDGYGYTFRGDVNGNGNIIIIGKDIRM